jgi:glycosyltransferase involved in cell wall biosynthesis
MSPHRPLNIFVPHCSDLLTDHLPHGDGLVAHGFIRHLAERGHELHVAVAATDIREPLPANVHLYSIESPRKGPLWTRMRYMLQVRRLFFRLSQRVDFDLVHQLNPVYTGMSLSLAGCKPPVILGPYIGGWPDDPAAISNSKMALRVLLRLAKRTIAGLQQHFAHLLLLTTPAAASRLVGRSALAKVQILPHGIDSDFFRPEDTGPTDRSIQTDAPRILFMASTTRRKGIFDLLQAFDGVAARFPLAHLLIAGEGSEFAEARTTASQLSSCDRINFLGRQDRAGAARVMQEADIYCLPSHGEPYGMGAVEAMSCGKPLVVTDAGGLGCLVDDQGGLRVPVGDPERLGNALCILLADPQRCRAMGEHNRRRVLETMDWKHVINRLEEVYFASSSAKTQAGSKRAAARTSVLPDNYA